MKLFYKLTYGMLISAILLRGMDNGRTTAFDIHREKFQGVLYTIQAARRAQVGLPIKEVHGMFGNTLPVSVDIYYSDDFYKTVSPETEIPLYSTNIFTINALYYSKIIQIPSLEKYFYAHIYLTKNNLPHVLTVENLQNLKLNTTPFNVVTNDQHPFDDETRALYKQKLDRIRTYNQ